MGSGLSGNYFRNLTYFVSLKSNSSGSWKYSWSLLAICSVISWFILFGELFGKEIFKSFSHLNKWTPDYFINNKRAVYSIRRSIRNQLCIKSKSLIILNLILAKKNNIWVTLPQFFCCFLDNYFLGLRPFAGIGFFYDQSLLYTIFVFYNE